jgi:hypothetical protein
MSAVDIGAELRTYLLADGTVAGLLGDRIAPEVIDQAETRPAASYRRISGVVNNVLAGATGTEQTRIQFDVVSASDKQVLAVAWAMQTRLAGFVRGSMNTACWIQELTIASAIRTGADPPRNGSTDWEYTASFDVWVVYKVDSV